MKNQKARRFCIGDVIVMLAVLLLSASLFAGFLSLGEGDRVEIEVNGEVVQTLSLKQEESYELTANGITLLICIEDGGVFVARADCPDRICESTGRITRGGASIVCAPAGVLIRVVRGGESNVDFIAG